jgi:hypothetical protein
MSAVRPILVRMVIWEGLKRFGLSKPIKYPSKQYRKNRNLSGMVNKVVFINIPDSMAWKGGSEKKARYM